MLVEFLIQVQFFSNWMGFTDNKTKTNTQKICTTNANLKLEMLTNMVNGKTLLKSSKTVSSLDNVEWFDVLQVNNSIEKEELLQYQTINLTHQTQKQKDLLNRNTQS
jgi:hypothetical protein